MPYRANVFTVDETPDTALVRCKWCPTWRVLVTPADVARVVQAHAVWSHPAYTVEHVSTRKAAARVVARRR